MKKEIFTKLFALFLVGGLLTTVGCKDYDDDIDALNKDVSDLKGEVVELNKLSERIAAVEGIAAEFKAINFGDFVKDTELATALANVQTDLAEKLKGYATMGALDDAKNALQAAIDAKTTMGDVKRELEAYAKKDASYSKAQMDTMLSDLETKINNSLGEKFAAYLTTYVTGDQFKGAASDAVLEKLTSENKAYVDALNAIIGKTVNPLKADLEAAVIKYDTAIANLWSAVGNLAGRIQSLVYVPKAAIDDVLYFVGYKLGDDASAPKLTENVSAEMAFRVSPASLAESLVKGYAAGTVKMSFIPEEVRYYMDNSRAEEQELVKIESVSYDPTAPGKIMIRAISRYDYVAAMREHGDIPKTLSIALCIKDSKLVGDKEDIETGIEFTSDYVPTDGEYENALSDFVQAKAKPDGTFAENGNNPVGYKLEYNDLVTKVELMKDYPLMYREYVDETGKYEYLTIDEAKDKFHWDITPELVFAHNNFHIEATEDQLVVTPADPIKDAAAKATPVVIKNNTIDKVSANNIGLAYQLLTKVSLKVGEAKIAMAAPQFYSVLYLTPKALKDIDFGTQTMTWKYAKFSATGAAADYATAEITLKAGALTAAQFNALYVAGGWELTANEGSIAVDGISVVGERVSTPSTDSDAQILKFAVKGYKLGNLNMKIKNSIRVNAGESINIEGTIVINGLPEEVAPCVINQPNLVYAGTWTNLVVSEETLLADLEKSIDPKGEFFAAGEFATAFAKTDANAPKLTSKKVTTKYGTPAKDGAKAQLKLGVAEATPVVMVDFFEVNFFQQSPIVYAAHKDDKIEFLGVKIPLKGSAVTFKASEHQLIKGSNLFDADPKDIHSLVYGKVVGDAFTLNTIDLKQSYTAEHLSKDLVVSYEVIKPNDKYTGNLPLIDGVNIMSWANCGLAEVEVKALLRFKGVIMDRKDFTVRLVQPVLYDTFGIRKVEGVAVSNEVKIPAGDVATTKNIYELMSMVDFQQPEGVEIFTDNGVTTLASDNAGYGVTVEFGALTFAPTGVDYSRFAFNYKTGVFTVAASQSTLAAEVTATVEVKLTDRYSVTLAADGTVAPKVTKKTVTVKFVPAK